MAKIVKYSEEEYMVCLDAHTYYLNLIDDEGSIVMQIDASILPERITFIKNMQSNHAMIITPDNTILMQMIVSGIEYLVPEGIIVDQEEVN